MLIPREPVRDDTPSTRALPAPASHCLRSEDLLGGRRDVLIQHGEEFYRLTQTRSGKLILTK